MKIITKTDFTKTLNLPKPTIEIKGNQVKKEDYILSKIQDEKKYLYVVNKNLKSGAKRYKIKELPTYIQSSLTSTVILNKILKDILIKSKLLEGNIVNHELTFTNAIDKNQISIDGTNKNNIQELIKIRTQKRKELDTTFKAQTLNINKLGTTINYEKQNTTTVKKEFDIAMIETFFKIYKEGRIKKELRPVYWCPKCAMAKSKKELKFVKKELDNYYILYRVEDDSGLLKKYNNLKNTYFIVSNVRPYLMVTSENIAIANELEYSLIETKLNNNIYHYIVASRYVDDVMQKEFIIKYEVKEVFKAEQLRNILCMNPLDYRKKVSVILTNEEYVCYDNESSTGVRTVSSGHTYIDYLILKHTKANAVKSIIDEHGKTNALALVYNNMDYLEVNTKIIEYLRNSKFIYTTQKAKVVVPVCAKCNNEVLYRCVNEWYIQKPHDVEITKEMTNLLKQKMVTNEKFKNEELQNAINKINKVKEAIISDKNMLSTPIPVFYCAECGNVIIKEKTIEILKKLFETKGSDAWYKLTPEEILQGQVSCNCGCVFFFKENATLNDLFKYICINENNRHKMNSENENKEENICIESKTEFIENLRALSFTTDLDIHLNEYNLILLHSNIRKKSKKEIQYETITLQNQKQKNKSNSKKEVQKNNKNMIGTFNIQIEDDIKDIVNDYGTDTLRLWAAISCINDKITLNKQTLVNVNRKYKDIRRTYKYILANLYDFNPTKNYININDRNDIDKYIYIKLYKLVKEVEAYYNELKFNKVCTDLIEFCIDVLCRNYFDSIKYNLYILLANDHKRRSIQSNLYDIVLTLSSLLAPIIPFTLEEIWPYIWHKTTEEERSLYTYRLKLEDIKDDELEKKWDSIFNVKLKLDKKIKKAQLDKIIKNTLEAKVIVNTNEFTSKFIKENNRAILECINVSSIEANISEKHDVIIEKEPGQKCARCGHYTQEIGKELKYRYLCPECAHILEEQ